MLTPSATKGNEEGYLVYGSTIAQWTLVILTLFVTRDFAVKSSLLL